MYKDEYYSIIKRYQYTPNYLNTNDFHLINPFSSLNVCSRFKVKKLNNCDNPSSCYTKPNKLEFNINNSKIHFELKNSSKFIENHTNKLKFNNSANTKLDKKLFDYKIKLPRFKNNNTLLNKKILDSKCNERISKVKDKFETINNEITIPNILTASSTVNKSIKRGVSPNLKENLYKGIQTNYTMSNEESPLEMFKSKRKMQRTFNYERNNPSSKITIDKEVDSHVSILNPLLETKSQLNNKNKHAKFIECPVLEIKFEENNIV